MTGWIAVEQGTAPLIVSIPHAGTQLPEPFGDAMISAELARFDTDWYVDRLYDFAPELGATVVMTHVSRSIIDVNRDPSGASLYPGQATTGLCPLTTFAGAPLYSEGRAPSEAEIAERRLCFFDPYHTALAAEIERLREAHAVVVLYEAHSIRSRVPRLFDGELPLFNIGTFDGRSCAPELTALIERAAHSFGDRQITNGRFKGGWTTRHYGNPGGDVHAVQMELAMRGYLDETEGDEPPVYDEARAGPMRATLRDILSQCIAFAKGQP